MKTKLKTSIVTVCISFVLAACGVENQSQLGTSYQAGSVTKGGSRKSETWSLGSMMKTKDFGRTSYLGITETHEVVNCGELQENGVVSSWTLNEKRKKYFHRSSFKCSPLTSGGVVDSRTTSTVRHFHNEGRGTRGVASFSAEKIPVGVRLRYKGGRGTHAEIVDIALLESTKEKIVAGEVDYNRANYALGQDGRDTKDLACPRGYVLTGIRIVDWYGDRDAQKIQGARIQCHQLQKSE